jgi:hypothetical protein
MVAVRLVGVAGAAAQAVSVISSHREAMKTNKNGIIERVNEEMVAL